MKNILILLLSILIISGCGSIEPRKNTGIIGKMENPPHLWSFHKVLEVEVKACALKGLSSLKSLGFKRVVQNGSYTYGIFNDNRAAVKCVDLEEKSLVYLAVAGQDKQIVEKLRNELAWKF